MGRIILVFAMVAMCADACASQSSRATSVVTTQPKAAGLGQMLPGDLSPASDCASSKDPTPRDFVGLTEQLNCVEGKGSAIAGAYIDAYLFRSADALAKSFDALNQAYNFFPASAQPECPPSSESAQGRKAWHGSEGLGTLECYTTSDGGHVFIWTNEPERALFLAKVQKAISFAKLHVWWTKTGCCT